MTNIQKLLCELVDQTSRAPSDNLNVLADIHTQIHLLMDLSTAPDVPASIGPRAKGLALEMENIIMREVTNADAALREVARDLAGMQFLLDGDVSADAPGSRNLGSASAPVAPPVSASPGVAPKPVAPHHADLTEHPFNPEDLALVHDFVVEAREHIESAETSVLKLEDSPADLEAINSIFRAFHTVKGVAGFLNLRQIGALAHSAESLLDLARQGKLKLGGPSVDLILSASDLLKKLVNAVDTAVASSSIVPREPALDAMLANLSACAAGVAVPTQKAEIAPQPKPVSEPPLQVMKHAAAAPDAAAQASAAAAHVPVSPPVTAPTCAAPAPHEAVSKPAAVETEKTKASAPAEASVKISTERLDSLINMVGELVIAQSMAAQDAKDYTVTNHRLARNLGHLAKITRELQELSMSMRMVPIQGVFQKMTRLVRDLEKKTGKKIDLEFAGGETELDRTLIEQITDPLVHMVRNSCDHGIEMPEDRVKSGKPPAGKLRLRAYHSSGSIAVEISDDGKGLNTARILSKAIANGILPEGAQPPEAEIFKLIFHAGLSTAEKVTDVSGRGVGMDVVKRNVESLRGRIDIASVEGKGAVFTISLPLTLAVIDGMVVKAGGQKFILPTLSVEQSLRPKAEQLSTVQGRGEVCLVRDHLLALYRLDELFGISKSKIDPTQAIVVIVNHDSRRCCLVVEELLGQQQVVIKSLGDGIGKVPGVSGSAILGDGNVSLILDVSGLMELASTSDLHTNSKRELL
jgi:two-component system chemotaxis sensor kinase CheA